MVIGGSRCDHRRSMMVNWAYCTIRFPPSHNRKRRYFYPKKTFNVRVPALSKTDSPIRSFLYYYTPLLLSLLPSCSLSFRLTRTDWKAIAKRTRVSTIVRGEVGEEFAGGRSKLGNGVSRERGCKRGGDGKGERKKGTKSVLLSSRRTISGIREWLPWIWIANLAYIAWHIFFLDIKGNRDNNSLRTKDAPLKSQEFIKKKTYS